MQCSQGEQFLDTVQDEVEEMFEAAEAASEHAGLVHAMPWVERAAGGCMGRSAGASLAGRVVDEQLQAA